MDKITIFLSVSTLKIIVLTTTIGQFTSAQVRFLTNSKLSSPYYTYQRPLLARRSFEHYTPRFHKKFSFTVCQWCLNNLRNRARNMRSSRMRCIDSRETIAHSTHLSIKKHNVAECVSTSAKQCVPMNMIGGSQTHPQQHSVAALGFFLSTKWNLPFKKPTTKNEKQVP
uniref:SFRICE_036231 n=1 Tax=Spodoptera frugiperda TaxID=7108 RepID=A0A2H1WZU3_SPOFR